MTWQFSEFSSHSHVNRVTCIVCTWIVYLGMDHGVNKNRSNRSLQTSAYIFLIWHVVNWNQLIMNFRHKVIWVWSGYCCYSEVQSQKIELWVKRIISIRLFWAWKSLWTCRKWQAVEFKLLNFHLWFLRPFYFKAIAKLKDGDL